MQLILLALAAAKADQGTAITALITGILGLVGVAVTAIVGYVKVTEQGKRQADLQKQSEANDKDLQRIIDANKKELQTLIGNQSRELENQTFEHAISQEVLRAEVSAMASSRTNLTTMVNLLARASERVRLLANIARQRQSASKLGNNTIEYKRTVYELLAPIAIADLSVRVNPLKEDIYFANLRTIAHCLRALMQADGALAVAAGLPYKPGGLERDEAPRTKENFRIYDQQGIISLQLVLTAFIVDGKPGDSTAPYVLDDRTFINGFSKPDFDSRIAEAGRLIAEFNPLDKPIFWLILITESMLARLANNAHGDLRVLNSSVPFTPLERRWFDWRPSLDGSVPEAAVLEAPFDAARAWIADRLPDGKSDA